jgi:hypothetical protein
MLGPALIKLHDRLTKIPADERTGEQQHLLAELTLLSEATTEISPVLAKVRALVNDAKLEFFSITRPLVPSTVTRPDPRTTKCSRCGQYFPVSTQPKA